jgi:hypothetical protein
MMMFRMISCLLVVGLVGCSSKPSLFDRCEIHVDPSQDAQSIYDEEELRALYARLNGGKPLSPESDVFSMTEGALTRQGSVDVSRVMRNMAKAQMLEGGASSSMAGYTAFLASNTYRTNAWAAPLENLCAQQKRLVRSDAVISRRPQE